MDFLAVSPGVHSIDTLTLTDVERVCNELEVSLGD